MLALSEVEVTLSMLLSGLSPESEKSAGLSPEIEISAGLSPETEKSG